MGYGLSYKNISGKIARHCRNQPAPLDNKRNPREDPMKYICLLHVDNAVFGTMTEQEQRDLDRDSLAYDQSLIARGNLITAEALQGPETSMLVKVRAGNLSVTDGPFSEAKEQVGGLLLIEARDMTEAVEIAGAVPMAKYSTIEVRPIYTIPQPDRP
jgi:hypothetical protein